MPLSDVNLGGHPSLIIMALFMNMATIATLLVQRTLASTHLLPKYVRMSMYQFCAYLVVGLMGPTKFTPHCKEGCDRMDKMCWSFTWPSKVAIEMACSATLITRDDKSGT